MNGFGTGASNIGTEMLNGMGGSSFVIGGIGNAEGLHFGLNRVIADDRSNHLGRTEVEVSPKGRSY